MDSIVPKDFMHKRSRMLQEVHEGGDNTLTVYGQFCYPLRTILCINRGISLVHGKEKITYQLVTNLSLTVDKIVTTVGNAHNCNQLITKIVHEQ